MAALTRISNNQAQSNSIHADKLQRYTLTGDIWANNLVYDSTLTVANLVVYGNSTTINSINTTISDPIIQINAEYTGSPVLDQALLFGRGDQDNVGLIWKELSGQQFQLVYTPDSANSNPGTITVNAFANLQIQDLAAVNANLSANLNADWVNANSLHAMANVYFDRDAVVVGNLYATEGTYTGNVIANSFYTVGPSGNIAGADFVIANYYVGNGSLLTGMYSNVNVAQYLPTDQTIIDLWTNAAVQSANIDALWDNAATQSANIDALWDNAAVQSANIDALWTNAAVQSANIDALWDNAATQSANIDALWTNAAVQSANIDALWTNAAVQSANIDALWDNAAVQSANIDALWSNVSSIGANIAELWDNAAVQSANIDALWSNAAVQDQEIGNIVSGNTTLYTVTTTLDANIGGNVNTSNWVNTNNINLLGALFANANAGLQGQYLTSTGTGAYWASHFYNDATPPDAPNYGDIWYYLDQNKLYMWVTDGESDFWYDFLPPTF